MSIKTSKDRGYGMSVYISTEMAKVMTQIDEYIHGRSSNNRYRSMSEFIVQAVREKAKREIG